MKYFNLSTHTHFSCGLGIGTSKEIIKKAIEKGLSGIAITDRNTFSGALDFLAAGKDAKFPVVLGYETFFINSMNDKVRITLLAKNQNGYFNICKLSSDSWNNEVVHKIPCVSIYSLYDYSKDLYCICDDASQNDQLKQIFSNSFFNEIILSEKNIEKNKAILASGNNFIITSDSYIPGPEYKMAQDIMIENSDYSEEKEKYSELKPILSFEELLNIWKVHAYYFPAEKFIEAIKNTNIIGESCSNIKLKFKDQVVNYPHLLHPLNLDGCSKEELVWRIIKDYGRLPNNQIYIDRAKYEMDSICNNSRVNLIDYFLVLEDLCRWCRENNITVGPGRGSGAGSLINYCLRITNLDPIIFGLLFERFISKGRIENGTLPDVDIDVACQESVRNYLIEKYGDDRVMRIGTFQTLKTLGSIKDVTKVLHPELDFMTVNNVTKTFGKKDQEESELDFYERNKELNPTAIEFFKKYPDILIEVDRLLGYNRQAGLHACGLAITQDPILDFAPTRISDGLRILGLTGSDCEKSGIIKYDILGLKTLKYIQKCCELIGLKDIYQIPLDDKETFKAFKNGDTASVFQFNSDVAINILTKLPEEKFSLDVLSMVTSVGRPGPMGNGQHEEFAKRMNGTKFAEPPHQALDEELKETYGIMIYQENVMRASQILGGFNLVEADDIRKAMGKKKVSVLKPYKERFIKSCQEKYPETKGIFNPHDPTSKISIAEHIWELMATFAGYGFNKSHSMAYAMIGYHCQYLKVHYPLEWWTACFTYAGDKHLKSYYLAAKDLCIHPDINDSTQEFKIVDGKIYFPLSSIKRLGPKATEELYKNRPYSSFTDFLNRSNKTRINKTVVIQLIFAGCFDKLHKGEYQELVNEYFKSREEDVPEEFQNLNSFKLKERRAKALSYLDMDLFDLHAEKYSEEFTKYDQINKSYDGKRINTFGKIEKIKKAETKTGKVYANVTVVNGEDSLKLKFWEDEYNCFKNSLKEKSDYKITGKISFWNDQPQLTVISIMELK